MTPKEEIQAVIIRIQRARRHVGPARLAHAHFRKKCQDERAQAPNQSILVTPMGV